MTNIRKKQIKTLGILLVAVITLAIGFAAFSSSLNIKTRLSVNPNNGTFLVKFSKSSTTLDESDIVPTKSSDIFTAYNGEIDNDTGIPTISNLGGQFTQPGEKITYDFYTLNTGSYNAYLTDVIFNNVEGESTNKVCTSVDGTHQSEVDEACKGISIKVILGIDTIINTRTITGHTLAPNQSEPVKVVIEYSSTAVLPEVEFTVDFGTISMIYNSLEESDVATVPQQQNVWQQRGLTSSNVTYGMIYMLQGGDEILGLYPDGSAYSDSMRISKETYDSVIENGIFIVGEDYILMNQGAIYLAIIFDTPNSFTAYADMDKASFTRDDIVNGAEQSAIYVLTGDSLPVSDSQFDTCSLITDSGNIGISVGDIVTCGTESFYVMEDPSNGRVKMLAEWNLNSIVGYQEQNETNLNQFDFWDDTAFFGYWTNGSNDSLNSNFTECTGESYCETKNGISYPIDVYGISNSTTGETSYLEESIDNYVDLLNSAVNGANATGRLITYKELINLGCSGNSCSGAPFWVYSTYYWTGTAYAYDDILIVGSDGTIINWNITNSSCIRPVIEINESVIQV